MLSGVRSAIEPKHQRPDPINKLGVIFQKLNKLSVIVRNGTFFLYGHDFNNLLVILADRCGTI